MTASSLPASSAEPPEPSADSDADQLPASLAQTPPDALRFRPWLHGYAMLLAVLIFILLGIGGTVTTNGFGMAVPDWPTTFGYNMFFAPLHVWWAHSGTFWEHFHRLVASFVGFLTIIVALWLGFTQKNRKWLRWTGAGLLTLVIIQGLLGGFRVTDNSQLLAGIHGVMGQLVLALAVLIATATSRPWIRTRNEKTAAAGASQQPQAPLVGVSVPRGMRYLALALLGILVIQISLGSWMRHTGSGLAIPDFPTNYGSWVPPLNQAQLNTANHAWPQPLPHYTIVQVGVNYAHRVWAMVVLGVSIWLVLWLTLRAPGQPLTKWPGRILLLLLSLQILLGASVIWSGRYPEIATAHQALGAGVLAVTVWLTVRIHLLDLATRTQADVRHGVAASTAMSGISGVVTSVAMSDGERPRIQMNP